MAYSKASGKAVAKYDKTHYKKATVKIPYMLILEELERDGFLREWYVVLNTMCYGVDN